MILKTYKTYYLKSLSFDIEGKNGGDLPILFQGGIHADSTARFVTDNPYIQKKLEESRFFNYSFFLEDSTVIEDPDKKEEAPAKEETPAPKVEEKPLTDVKDIKRFHNLVEMRNYMAEIGLAVTPDMNYLQCKATALKEGYDFQIQK